MAIFSVKEVSPSLKEIVIQNIKNIMKLKKVWKMYIKMLTMVHMY